MAINLQQALTLPFGRASIYLDARFLLVLADPSDTRSGDVVHLIHRWRSSGIGRLGEGMSDLRISW